MYNRVACEVRLNCTTRCERTVPKRQVAKFGGRNRQYSMSNPQGYPKILFSAYDKFMLPLGGKRVPTPYRRNETGSFQKIGSQFQGKSSPEILTETTKRLAKEQNFNLGKASVEEIREFMKKNKLGIDCSGFVYRMLNHLVEKLGLGNLEKAAGFPHVGRTNIAKMTSDGFSVPVTDLSKAQPGDIIRLNSEGDILHGVIILQNSGGIITYAHSSNETNPSGVHQDKTVSNQLPPDLSYFSYNINKGDGIRRLKILA